jgi:hypothetical protein
MPGFYKTSTIPKFLRFNINNSWTHPCLIDFFQTEVAKVQNNEIWMLFWRFLFIRKDTSWKRMFQMLKVYYMNKYQGHNVCVIFHVSSPFFGLQIYSRQRHYLAT